VKKASETSRVLRYPGSTIQVKGPGSDVQWAVQFLGPGFSSRKAGEADWQVRLVRDPAAFERCLRSGPDPRARRRSCFYLDSRTETLPLWRGPRGATTVFDRHHEVFACVRRKGVELLGRDGGRLPRLALMRIVREHALSRLMGLPGLLLHASALVVDGEAALMVGGKRSGKTSLMLHALGLGRAYASFFREPVRYLANDRVWLSFSGPTPAVRSFPTISSLRLSSLAFFPEIAATLEKNTFVPAATLREGRLRSAPLAGPWNGLEYTLSPIQFCRTLGVEASAAAEVGVLLFPRVTGRNGRIRMIPMGRAEAENAVRRGLFRAGSPQKAGGLFAASGHPRRLQGETTTRRIRELVGRVPCYSVELGLGAYSDRNWLERLRTKLKD
jgi:hypothetical protein